MRKILVITLILIVIYKIANKLGEDNNFNTSEFNGDEVVLYATDWCGYCRKTREFFAKNNIQYTEFDIEKSAEGKRQYDKVKKRDGVPVVVIKGYAIQGYSERQMRWALDAL